jgi:hypothetical protein
LAGSAENMGDIQDALKLIFEGIDRLQKCCDGSRKFTIDGRLVGDIGEIIAEREYVIELDKVSRAHHDAKTPDGRDVQIKATFQNSLTFTVAPVLYIGLRLFNDGTHEEVYNGPGQLIADEYQHRKGIGEKLLSFPIARLRELSGTVPGDERVARRNTSQLMS